VGDQVSRPSGHDPGLAGDRTTLAWVRSALSIAGTGVLTARAAAVAHLWTLGVLAGIVMAAMSLSVYRHAQRIYPGRRLPERAGSHHQMAAFRLLTLATFVVAIIAAVVVVIS
jgi:uncharacterized membrane protein YidH (DUF202 family)